MCTFSVSLGSVPCAPGLFGSFVWAPALCVERAPFGSRVHLRRYPFYPPIIVRLSLSWEFMIRLFRSGICAPCTIFHLSSIFPFSCFSGHVHVGHVYGFGRIPRCVTTLARMGLFRNMGIVSRRGLEAPIRICAVLPVA